MAFGAVAAEYDRLRPTPPSAAVDWLLPSSRDVAADVGAGTIAAMAEAIPLADGSVDAVYISSAWHWMDPFRAVPEVVRILRPGGRLGIIWDLEVDWLENLSHSNIVGCQQGVEALEVAIPGNAPIVNVQTRVFRFVRRMTLDGVIDLLKTYSGFIVASPEDRNDGLEHARSVLQSRFPCADRIEFPMWSWCWRADRGPLVD